MTESSPDPISDPQLAGLRSGLAGRYQLVRQIGEGGMAVVLLARDLQHGRPVALKVLRPELTAALGGERFHQEIRLTARIQHPHIVSIYDSGETDGKLWYTMPFIEGESLRQILRREEQLPLPEATRIIIEACRALAAAHQAGVVHRDIKPENLLITPAGDVYVVDFGVARGVDSASLTRTGIAVGTPQYMSPEQASGTAGPRSDVYALGCVLYEMLAGEPPFDSRTPQAISAKHINAPIPDVRIVRETVPPALEQVLRTALAKSPADRYANAGELADAIEKALASPQGPWSISKPVAAITGALIAIAAVVLVTIRFWPPRPAAGSTHRPSPILAVLYFENGDPDTTLNAVADAVTEEVIREFTGEGNAFRVVSKYGVRQFKDGTTPIDTMRARLSADYWIAGVVRKAGAGVVVDAQLIDALTNIVVDSVSTPPLPGASTHELAANAALGVANSLKRKLRLEVRLAQAVDTSAVPLANSFFNEAERYRREAEQYQDIRDTAGVSIATEAFRRADSLLARAAQADPQWLRPGIERAWVGLGMARLQADLPQAATLRRALLFADTAVARAPNDPLAKEARGTIRFKLQGALNSADTAAYRVAADDLRDAVGRDSLNARAWATLGEILWLTGRLDEAELASNTALRVDPFLNNAKEVKRILFALNTTLGRFNTANDICRRMRLAEPDDWYSRQCELTLLRHDYTKPPNPRRAWQLVAELDSVDPPAKARAAGHMITVVYRRLLAGFLDARAGNYARAESTLVWARRTAANDSILKVDMAVDEAILLLGLGRRDSAQLLVNRFFQLRPLQKPSSERDAFYRWIFEQLKEAPGTPPR